MKAVILYGKRDLRIEEVEKPVPGPNEVLIKINKSGICNSIDYHCYIKEDVWGELAIESDEPHGLGHESTGRVVEVGKEVSDMKVGDRVFSAGFGAWAEFLKAPAGVTFKIPEDMPENHAAMLEPVLATTSCVDLASIELGSTVALLGLGPSGLLICNLLAHVGARSVIAIDRIKCRLNMAEELGADEIVNFDQVDSVAKVKDLTGGEGADVVIEAAGTSDAFTHAMRMVRPGGKVVIYGTHRRQEKHDFSLLRKGFIIINSACPDLQRLHREAQKAIGLVQRSWLQLDKLLSKEIKLEEVEKTLKQIGDGSGKLIKVLINLNFPS